MATAEGNDELQSRSQEMAGWWVSRVSFGLQDASRKRRCSALGKTNRDEARTRNERWEMDRQRWRCQSKIVKEAVSVNTKKESRRTCLTGSGTCPLSVRGLSVRPKADWGWVLNDPNKGGQQAKISPKGLRAMAF